MLYEVITGSSLVGCCGEGAAVEAGATLRASHVAAGVVTHEREQPNGVGAPAHVFRLTARGEALFPRRRNNFV